MDRQALLRRLARTEEYIREGKRRIHDQQLKIYGLELRGRDTRIAQDRLKDLQKSQGLYEENWRTYLRQLRK